MQPVIIKRDRVTLGPSKQPGGHAHAEPAAPARRGEVRTILDQGVVVALEVVCGCGEISLVELRFPEAAEVGS